MAPSISKEDHDLIIKMWQQGLSVSEISRRLPYSRVTINLWVKRWQEYGEDGLQDRRINNGPSKATNASQDEELINKVKENPFSSISNIIRDSNIPISKWTARRRVHEAGIHCYRAANKIDLTQNHRNKRVDFALNELNTTAEEWDVTIWSDEKTFRSSDDNKFLVWRPTNKRFNPEYVIPNKSSGHITCGMWGWISAFGPGELVQVSPNMNAEEYIDILENVMLPSVRAIFPVDDVPSFRLVQDNNAVHTARIVKLWFHDHPEIKVLPWPPKSPDLNLIENIWSHIVQMWNNPKRKIKGTTDATCIAAMGRFAKQARHF